MASKNNTILVTGGAGYIGSHVCKALAAAGYLPVVYDNLSRGHAWAVKWGPLEQGDIRDGDRLRKVVTRHKPSAVMHFAAYIAVGESVDNPAIYYANNVAGSLSLLEVMRETRLHRLVFSSTCAVYGEPQRLPLTEAHPISPVSPYAHSKAMIEQMAFDFDTAYNIKTVALRYFNASGADPGGDIGEAHEPETHLLPLVLEAAAGKRAAINVFGDDYDTPDGTCVRDYIHVSDLAEAHLLALKRLEAGGESAAYNLGNGSGFTVREVIQAARRVTARPVKEVTGARRAGDVPVLVGDSAKAIADLGWQPRFADLETIIETAWKWHQKYHDGGR